MNKIVFILFTLFWMSKASAQGARTCGQLSDLRNPEQLTTDHRTPPPGSVFRNVLILEFTNGRRIYARTPMVAGVRHQDMWDHATELYGERPRILFAGEEVIGPERATIWVKDRSRLNSPKNRNQQNESHISHYKAATGFSHVIELPYSEAEPHLHPYLNSQAKVILGEIDVKHDLIDPVIIGTLQHLKSLFKDDDSDRSAILGRLRADLQRKEFAVLMESLRIDGVDTQQADEAIAKILTPTDFPNFIALNSLKSFLERFEPGVRIDTASRVEWLELPVRALSDTSMPRRQP